MSTHGFALFDLGLARLETALLRLVLLGGLALELRFGALELLPRGGLEARGFGAGVAQQAIGVRREKFASCRWGRIRTMDVKRSLLALARLLQLKINE